MRIKICGITNLEDANFSARLGADAIGFIFYPKSKRFIDFEKAKYISNSLPSFIHKVGVFVNETSEQINLISKIIGLTIVQLHGEENQNMIDEVNLPVIKAIRINDENDFKKIKGYNNCKILLDAYSIDEYGGSGKKFNWNEIPVEMKSKIILSGGIKTDDLEFIFSEINPEAIDLSSSVEISPGIKDQVKLRELFNVYNKLRGY